MRPEARDGRDHRVALGDRRRHGLLDEHVLAGLEQRDRLGRVQGVRGGDDRGVDVGVAGEPAQSVVTRAIAVSLGERDRARLAMVRDGDELAAVLQHTPRMEVLDPPAAEQRDAHAAHPFTPVSVTPSMNTRWARKNSTITGSMNSTDAAIMRLYST